MFRRFSSLAIIILDIPDWTKPMYNSSNAREFTADITGNEAAKIMN
jgi:hypothetical protein